MKRLIYHTVTDAVYKEFGTSKNFVSGTITGLEKDLKVGDKFSFNGINIECVEILEQRKHNGVFFNPTDADNAFFKARFIANS